jgi:Zn-dependent peptidase ImmA (M78 family)/O-acetyl-ADP-ribose deacetylase (regulator of RNase III)
MVGRQFMTPAQREMLRRKKMPEQTWTHPSVRHLLEENPQADGDALSLIEARAREIALEAIEKGWNGPPYDPFGLAEVLKIEVVAAQDLDDARLMKVGERPRIEFNPQRRPARVRFSIAHEIGHFLFDDYGERIRYRDPSERRDDDWQLEMLCNVAAAEFLMPAGAFPEARTTDLSLSHLLDLRRDFHVSTEALLRRVVRLTDQPASLFTAARLPDGSFRVDYLVASRHWRPALKAGENIAESSVLANCTAVGFSAEGTEVWGGEEIAIQAVGVPPYPGDTFPRLVGLLCPIEGVEDSSPGIRYLRGDITQPRREGPAVIVHVVNNQARRWGGHGVAAALGRKYPDQATEYQQWNEAEGRRLGDVHLAEVEAGLWIASLVAQAGYGPSEKPRLRLRALKNCLRDLAEHAGKLEAGVHMPLIGTGQAGARWPQVRDLVFEELVDHGIGVTVYVLEDSRMPEEASSDEQLTLA